MCSHECNIIWSLSFGTANCNSTFDFIRKGVASLVTFSGCKPCLFRLHNPCYNSSVSSVHQRMALRPHPSRTRGKGKTLDADPDIAKLCGTHDDQVHVGNSGHPGITTHEEVFIPPFLSLIAIPTPVSHKTAAFSNEASQK
jgi:hypothetical protein